MERFYTGRVVFSVLILCDMALGCASDATRRSEQDMIVVEKKSDHQYVAEFDGKFARDLAKGDISLTPEGGEKYVLQHEDKTYYFGSAEAKSKFEQGIEDESQHASHNWQNAVVGSRQPS